MNPWKRCQSGEKDVKKDGRKMDLWAADIRKRQTHLIRLRATDFIQEMGFFVSHQSSSILAHLPRIFPPFWHPQCPHHLDELLCCNLRMFTSCYGEKQSGEQKEENDSEWWQSWQVAVCISAECDCRAKRRSATSPEWRSSSSLISSWTRRRRRSCKMSCSSTPVSKPRRSRWWSLSLRSARPGGRTCTGRKGV